MADTAGIRAATKGGQYPEGIQAAATDTSGIPLQMPAAEEPDINTIRTVTAVQAEAGLISSYTVIRRLLAFG